MKHPKLSKLVSDFSAFCAELGEVRTLHTHPMNDGGAHADFFDDKFHYIGTERGVEIYHRETSDQREALYWFLSDVVGDLAIAYARKNVRPGVDFRRELFDKEIELMSRLDTNWGVRKKLEVQDILRASPYVDIRDD